MEKPLPNYERLGVFYLGRRFDPATGATLPEPILYDSKDLTTHALCVGMTGSGKTGLCLALLEEAALDGIPVIAIDPKGDLGNLLLAFPDLLPGDFQPWIDPSAAARQGKSIEELAAATAETWRSGLAKWDQDGERIRRFRDAADMAIHTPGGGGGLSLAILRTLVAPTAETIADRDAFLDRIGSTAQGLLSLLGIDADPVRSREFILISNLLEDAWKTGQDLPLAELMRRIQSPPFQQVGLIDLESFFPAKERTALAMMLNNLFASPSFKPWTEGAPLDINSLLYTSEGKPKISIVSIAHLNDQERMFFVTLLLNEVLGWMRSQSGTGSLRAILYMDEIYGYFPPSAVPPSKRPMLTLLKQARAFGLGIVLSTQNPVDLDYKGLANCGTWFLGRLQTERDKERVLDGLLSASGGGLDRSEIERMLSSLGNRVFLLHNVHEDHPVLFQSRWALSYLAGPLSSPQIKRLMELRRSPASASGPAALPPSPAPTESAVLTGGTRPLVAAGIQEVFLSGPAAVEGRRIVYRPALLGKVRLHFVSSKLGVDAWRTYTLLTLSDAADDANPWENAKYVTDDPAMSSEPSAGCEFTSLPPSWTSTKAQDSWTRDLNSFAQRGIALNLSRCARLKTVANVGESEAEFRARLALAARESRDELVEKLRSKYAPKLARQHERIRQADERIAREKSQAHDQTLQTAMNFGSSLLGALFGKKLASRTNVTRAASSMRSMSRATKEHGDVALAQENLEAEKEKLRALKAEIAEAAAKIDSAAQPNALEIENEKIRPRKSDLEVEWVKLAWIPWSVDAAGTAEMAANISLTPIS